MSNRCQNLHSISHQYYLKRLFHEDVSIVKKKNENESFHNNTFNTSYGSPFKALDWTTSSKQRNNNNNFDSSMVWASPQTEKRPCSVSTPRPRRILETLFLGEAKRQCFLDSHSRSCTVCGTLGSAPHLHLRPPRVRGERAG